MRASRNVNKKRMNLKQKKRRQRDQILMGGVGILCVVLLMATSYFNNAADGAYLSDSWLVAEGELQIAAPPLEDGYGTLDYVGTDDETLAPFAQPTPDFVAPSESLAPVATPEPEPSLGPVSITITAAGDCTLGGDTQSQGEGRFAKAVKKNGYDFFLANVREIFENDDITIINLEGTLTTSKKPRSGRKFLFRGKPEYVQILSGSSVEVCNIANNHAKDYGSTGQEDTYSVLRQAGIGASGYEWIHYQEVHGLTVGFVGLTQWDYTISQVEEIVLDVREQCDLLVVSVHWGEEREYSATSTQKEYGRAIIDAGADLVLGHHPHVIGGLEQYRDKYIVYSLGNFCFGGNGNPSDKDTLIFQQKFEIALDGTVSDAGINVIPCSVSSVKNSNNFQPTPLKDEAYSKLMKKIVKYSKVENVLFFEKN